MTDEIERTYDRYRDLSEGEQLIASMRRGGEDIIDRQGRPKVKLGNGPESRLVMATEHVRLTAQRRASSGLDELDWKRAYEGIATANLRGWVLNTFVTISWEVGGIHDLGQVADLQHKFLARLREWCRHKQEISEVEVPNAAIWVKEVGKKLGLHTHFLIHIPHELRFAFRDWLPSTTANLVEVPRERRRPRPKHLPYHSGPNFDRDTEQQWRIFDYLMKDFEITSLTLSTAPHQRLLVEEFGGTEPTSMKLVSGARVGRTASIGPAATAAARRGIGAWPFYPVEGGRFPHNHFLHGAELHRQLIAIEI